MCSIQATKVACERYPHFACRPGVTLKPCLLPERKISKKFLMAKTLKVGKHRIAACTYQPMFCFSCVVKVTDD